MQLCDRCDGGERLGVNCPVCGGSGMMALERAASTAQAPRIPPVSDDFRRQQTQAVRQAREEEKRRRVKQYRLPEPQKRLTKAERAAIRAEYLKRKKQQAKQRQYEYMARLNQLTLSPITQIDKERFS